MFLGFNVSFHCCWLVRVDLRKRKNATRRAKEMVSHLTKHVTYGVCSSIFRHFRVCLRWFFSIYVSWCCGQWIHVYQPIIILASTMMPQTPKIWPWIVLTCQSCNSFSSLFFRSTSFSVDNVKNTRMWPCTDFDYLTIFQVVAIVETLLWCRRIRIDFSIHSWWNTENFVIPSYENLFEKKNEKKK